MWKLWKSLVDFCFSRSFSSWLVDPDSSLWLSPIGTMAHATASARAVLCFSPPPPPLPCLSPLLWGGGVAQRGKEGFLIACGSCQWLRTWHLVCPDSCVPLSPSHYTQTLIHIVKWVQTWPHRTSKHTCKWPHKLCSSINECHYFSLCNCLLTFPIFFLLRAPLSMCLMAFPVSWAMESYIQITTSLEHFVAPQGINLSLLRPHQVFIH